IWRSAVEDRLSDWRERAEDGRTHGRYRGGDRQSGRGRARQLPQERSRRERLRDPRTRHLPHGSGPEAIRAERVQPDARGEERLRGRWIRLPDRDREEPDTDDPGAVLARHRPPGGGDQTWQSLIQT